MATEEKKKRISIDRVDQYVEDKACFGWELVSKEDLKPNHTILLNFQRNTENIDDLKAAKKLEKQYDKMSRRVPLFFIILTLIGGALLAAYFLLKPYLFFYLAFLIAALTCFSIAFFSLVIFLLLLIKKKDIISYLLTEASLRTGQTKEFPTKHNIKEENEYSWALTKTFKS